MRGGSRAVVQGLRADRVDVAVGSAGAQVAVRDARIGLASTAAFLAYDEGRLDASRVIFEADPVKALVQAGSEATLNGLAHPAA